MKRTRWITRPISANYGTDEEYAAALRQADEETLQHRRDHARRLYWAGKGLPTPPRRTHIRPDHSLLVLKLSQAPPMRKKGGKMLTWCWSCCRYATPSGIVCVDCQRGDGPALPSYAKAYLKPGALAKLRRNKGWSQPHLASLWNTCVSSVSLIEAGKQRAWLWHIRLVARAAGWALKTTTSRLGINDIDRLVLRRSMSHRT